MCAPFAKHRAHNPTCIHFFFFLTLRDSSNLGLLIVLNFELLGKTIMIFQNYFNVIQT